MKKMSYYESKDQLAVLDLFAAFNFKSTSSISFLLGTESDKLLLGDGTSIQCGNGAVFNVVGSADVHFPCYDHVKARVRVILPEGYHTYDQMQQLVKQLFWELAIPADETYDAAFLSASHQTSIEQAIDRNGLTDRI
jgi:hypothetical protein